MNRRFNALRNVHPADTFPLALASGAVLQQIIFVAVQSTSLHSVLSNKCRGLSMITFPGMYKPEARENDKTKMPSNLPGRIHYHGLRHRNGL